jgi:NAD(P)H-flavin reductase
MDRRRILLIWSNRTQKQVVYPDEFQELENALPGLEIIQVLTREPGYEGETGRLEKEKLKRLLDGQSRDSVVLVCGPPQMMLAVKDTLLDLGFPRGSVYMERFEI